MRFKVERDTLAEAVAWVARSTLNRIAAASIPPGAAHRGAHMHTDTRH